MNYKTIDLFAGCGGLSQGFLKEEFEIPLANEFWMPAADTYEFNHEKTDVIRGDICSFDIKERIYELLEGQHVNVVMGGIPCVGYSLAGNRSPIDPRGHLYLDFLDVVNHARPDFFVIENVKGLVSMKHVNPHVSETEREHVHRACNLVKRFKDLKRFKSQRKLKAWEEKEFVILKPQMRESNKLIKEYLVPLLGIIIKYFERIGYKVSWKVLNSANYGVPQIRERIFIIGTKHEHVDITFPEGNFSRENWITSREVLEKYEKWEENDELNHVFTKHKLQTIERLSKVSIGKNLYPRYSDAWWRLDPNKPARTVKENHGGVFIHYELNRVCTPRELAALQSFDDDFIFKGSKSDVLKQIGNAVPPLMAQAVARCLKTQLNEIGI